MVNDSASRLPGGPFHVFGPAIGKARLPTATSSILLLKLSKRKHKSLLFAMLWAELAKSSKAIFCLLVLVEFSLGLR